jgi:glycerol-3-phosphate dehydrogenase
MIGGKWTTFRSFGALAADLVFDRLGAERIVDTADMPIGGGKDFPADRAGWISTTAQRSGLSRARVSELLERYGSAASEMAKFVGDDAGIGGHSRAELSHLVANEHVETLADLLLRRTTIGITGALSLGVIETCLAILGDAKGWPTARRETALNEFLTDLMNRHGLDYATLAARDQRTFA